MSSTSRASTAKKSAKPAKRKTPAQDVQDFRALLEAALKTTDEQRRKIGTAKCGIYAFYDYDGEPIYVGQTKEKISTRVRRHLTNQRTDAVAMRILDVFEVAEMELWPLWDLQDVDFRIAAQKEPAQKRLDAAEYTAYLQAIDKSKFKAILNEKIPPLSEPIELPVSMRLQLISDETRRDRGHDDIRIARRAETISRLAAVARERGEVSDGLRRVLVIQAVRLAYLAARRFSYIEGRREPDPAAINVEDLIGSVLYEPGDPHGELRGEEGEEDLVS